MVKHVVDDGASSPDVEIRWRLEQAPEGCVQLVAEDNSGHQQTVLGVSEEGLELYHLYGVSSWGFIEGKPIPLVK